MLHDQRGPTGMRAIGSASMSTLQLPSSALVNAGDLTWDVVVLRELLESDAIIQYLFNEYGDGNVRQIFG